METVPATPIVSRSASPSYGAGARGGSPVCPGAPIRRMNAGVPRQRITGLALQQISSELDEAKRNVSDARAQLLAVAEQLDMTEEEFGARRDLIELQRAVACAITLAELLEETEGERHAVVRQMKEAIRRCRLLFGVFRDRADVVDEE